MIMIGRLKRTLGFQIKSNVSGSVNMIAMIRSYTNSFTVINHFNKVSYNSRYKINAMIMEYLNN